MLLSCRRLLPFRSCSLPLVSRLLVVRHSSSSTDLSALLQEQASTFEKKPSTTIAYETFVQTPAEFVANSLVHIHDSLSLPWWATIALTTCAYRVFVGASITIAQQHFIERLQTVRQSVSNELEPRIKILSIQAMQGKTASILEEKKQLKREAALMAKRGYAEYNVHPSKLLILALFGSIPWLYFTFAIRMICTSPITLPNVSREGLLWFQNLAEADPYGLLPLAFLAPALVGITFNSIDKNAPASTRFFSARRIQRGITRTVVIGFTFIAFKIPTGIVLFWTLNSCMQLAQTILFELPRVRTLFGLQPSRFGSHPIRLRWTIWKDQWSFFFRTLKWYSKL